MYLGIIYVWSVLTSGSECWTISKEMEKRLLTVKMWFLGRIFRISWTEKKTNEGVLRVTDTDRSLLRLLRKRKMEFFGHHDGVEKLMLHRKVEGRRARGRRQIFMDSLSRFINTSNKSLPKLDIFLQTEGREAWKSLIVDVCPRPDT
ncbi:retrovirus-related Pol polyprotein LINE-1 [Elysia marginata]|uniref:Retrovirus-related Pol polyprotein LINE-1 n=1 Tax=Elysia marginata TaxID=1093978 RepID=A0AAV4HA46_9GAST|nr:retrovirus-related Pol polyprotein LINE-1 [Elysia marginata]